MTRKECIALLIRYAEYDGMGIPNLDGCREAMRMAVELLSQPQPSLPSDLDEVTMDFARELDFFLYGSYTPERFPNSMQVRDEHSGLKVNDWKSWVNRPELRIEMVKHFFTLGKQAGAEWMAEQGQTIVSLVWRDEDDKLFIEAFVDENEFKMADKIIIQIRKKS